MLNILASIAGITSFGDGFGAVSLSYEWICKIITWLVTFAGDVGLGIILFTLALKLITLPMDIASRASMKKNSLKMEMMREDLEKLQKQYANNQQLYQQKMMALYKKNGYSAFSACLPTIVTLIFFFVVIAAFNSYSKFTDKDVFNRMGAAYTLSIEESEKKGDVVKGEGNEYLPDINNALKKKGYQAFFPDYSETVNTNLSGYTSFQKTQEFLEKYPSVAEYYGENGYNFSDARLNDLINVDVDRFLIGKLSSSEKSSMESEGIIRSETIVDLEKFYQKAPSFLKEYLTESVTEEGDIRTYSVDYEKIMDEDEELKEKFNSEAEEYVAQEAVKAVVEEYMNETVVYAARLAAKDAYYENRSQSVLFPWVKNLWVTDSPFSRALPTYKDFTSSMQASSCGGNKNADNVGTLTEDAYNEITYLLSAEKETGFGKGNGYFILIALSILSMLGSTLITNKMQKTQMQLSTVDGENGQAAATQKMMTWMMPIMFGVFAFMYSAAFSIYMVTSSILSTGFTLLINFFVEKSFKKKMEEIEAEKAKKQKYGKKR